MKFPATARYIVSLVAIAIWLGACGGGGGGGGGGGVILPPIIAEIEPNNLPGEATPLPAGGIAVGTVETLGDTDFWAIDVAAGQLLQIELFAHRHDQDTWDTACSRPGLAVLRPSGTTRRYHSDPAPGVLGWGWPGGWGDLDIPFLHAKEAGTYTVAVTALPAPSPGGDYALRVRPLLLGPVQFEAELDGVLGDNDLPHLAEPLMPGALVGGAGVGDVDWYRIELTEPSLLSFDLTAYRSGIWDVSDDYLATEINLYRIDGVTGVGRGIATHFLDPAVSTRVIAPGSYLVRIVNTPAGTGLAHYLLRYAVSPGTGTAESEPNDAFDEADAMAYDELVSGSIEPGNLDWYSFSGQAGDLIRIWSYDRRNCGWVTSQFSTIVYDTDGVSPLPDNHATLAPVESLNVTRTILPRTGTFYVRAEGPFAATDYAFRVERVKTALWETEPNDDHASANPLNAGGRAAGVIDAPGDVDGFAFHATAGEFVQIAVYARPGVMDGAWELSGHGSLLMPAVLVYDPSDIWLAGAWNVPAGACAIAESTSDPLPTITVSFVAPSTGRHTLLLIDERLHGSSSHTYVVERR